MPSRVPDALQIPSAFLAPPVPPGTHFIQARLPIPLRHPVFTPLSCPYSASLPVFPFPSLTPRRPGKSRAGCHRPADTVPGLSRAPFPAPALAGTRHRAAKEPCRQLTAPYQAAPYTVPGLSRAPFPAPALAGAIPPAGKNTHRGSLRSLARHPLHASPPRPRRREFPAAAHAPPGHIPCRQEPCRQRTVPSIDGTVSGGTTYRAANWRHRIRRHHAVPAIAGTTYRAVN